MEHLFIQKTQLDLKATHAALAAAFPAATFSLSGPNFTDSLSELAAFQVFAQGSVESPVAAAWPVHPEIRAYASIATVCSARASICMCWFDDDLGSAATISSQSRISHFSAESEDALYSLRSQKVEVTDRILSDLDTIEAFKLLNSTLREFLPDTTVTYEELADNFHASSQPQFSDFADPGIWNQSNP